MRNPHETFVHRNFLSCLCPNDRSDFRDLSTPRDATKSQHLQVLLAFLQKITISLDLLLQACLNGEQKAIFLILALGLCPDLSQLFLQAVDLFLDLLQLPTVAVLGVFQGLLQG